MAKTWATKCCSGTYKNNYQLCCGIKVKIKESHQYLSYSLILFVKKTDFDFFAIFVGSYLFNIDKQGIIVYVI